MHHLLPYVKFLNISRKYTLDEKLYLPGCRDLLITSVFRSHNIRRKMLSPRDAAARVKMKSPTDYNGSEPPATRITTTTYPSTLPFSKLLSAVAFNTLKRTEPNRFGKSNFICIFGLVINVVMMAA